MSDQPLQAVWVATDGAPVLQTGEFGMLEAVDIARLLEFIGLTQAPPGPEMRE